MNAWLIGIVGIVVLGVGIELLLSDSPMSKFVRSIYAFFVLFVIVQPLPGLIRGLTNMDFGTVEVNHELAARINDQTAQALGTSAQGHLHTAGFQNVLVVVEHSRASTNFVIIKVHINASNVNITGAARDSRNVRASITHIVTAVLRVDEDIINYLG